MSASRKTVASLLKTATHSYLLRSGFSCLEELGIEAWGKRRADIIAVNLKSVLVIAEVKSCAADYLGDNKWREYLPKCHKLYFVFTTPTFNKLRDRLKIDLKGTGAGVLVLNEVTGYLDSKVSAKHRPMMKKVKLHIITRLAWRQGVSKRTNRRTRIFIPEGASK